MMWSAMELPVGKAAGVVRVLDRELHASTIYILA